MRATLNANIRSNHVSSLVLPPSPSARRCRTRVRIVRPPEGFRPWESSRRLQAVGLVSRHNFSSAGYSTTGSPYKPSGRPRRRMRVWLNASHGATPRRVVGLLVHTSTITSPHAMPTYSTFMYAWLLLVRAWTWLLAIMQDYIVSSEYFAKVNNANTNMLPIRS